MLFGAPIEYDGAKARHANRAARRPAANVVEEAANFRERRDRVRGRESQLGVNRAVLIADGADEFCAAGLDGAEYARLAVHHVLVTGAHWSIAYLSGYNAC